MTATARAPIVVGVDGSPPSYRALDWAIAAAQRYEAPLRILHVCRSDSVAADEVTGKAEAYARYALPGLDVSTHVGYGHPAERLVEESARAAMVVVGHRGRGGFRGLLAGSVSVRTAGHAHGPVVVVRPHSTPQGGDGVLHHGVGRVVVGVDGSDTSEATVAFAFREALLRGVGLTAVHCWRVPVPAGPGDVILAACDSIDYEAEGKALLTGVLGPLQERHPRVPVHTVVVRDQAAAALIAESVGAELLVVGSRGYGGFTGLLLGSVSHAAIHHAECPAAVVHR
jgi:nucleotide-binding universal stress UspA family protein